MSNRGAPSVLITGAGGFIGRALTPLFAAAGYRVLGADLAEGPTPVGLAGYRRFDAADPTAIDALVQFGPVDAIVHAGGVSGYMVARDDPQRIFDVNVAGTQRLLEFARNGRVRRVVLCSTIMVYGPAKLDRPPLVETEYPVPASVYGASKLAIESLAHGYAGQFGLDVVSLRFSHVYGPGRITECFLRDLVAAALGSGRCAVSQPADAVRQYVHVDDVCAAVMAAVTAPALAERVFNISAGQLHTLSEVGEIVRSAVGPLEITFDTANEVPAYRIPQLSIARAAAGLGYRPALPLAAGVQALAAAMR